MKNNNKLEVLNLILLNEKITRNEIAEKLSLSKMGVSKIVSKFLDKNIILENKNKFSNSSGRKSKYLSIKKEKFGEILCIYFGLQNIEIQVLNMERNIKLKKTIEIINFNNILTTIFKEIGEIISKRKIMLISIGMNGIVNSKEGRILVSTYYHWTELDIKKMIEDKFLITTVIENGVNLIALAQRKKSNNSNKNFVVLNIENGVGYTTCEINSKNKEIIFKTGEIGHAPFDYSKDAFVCVCGNKGCLETKLANWRIEEKVFYDLKEKYSYEEIIENSNRNKVYFRNLILCLTTPLSHAILWIHYLINPEKIIITGKITKCEKYFWQELEREIKNNLLNKDKKIDIEKADYEENIIIKGAFYFGIENLRDSLFIKKILEGEKNE